MMPVMPMFSFLHAADIHLDSPLLGLARYEGAPVEEIRGATRRALDNLVEYALEHAIPLMVLAGDVYDADCPDFQTLLHFSRQMSRLGEKGVQVVMIRGNHDADNRMTSALRLPDNVTVLPSSGPGTWRSATLPVAVHGRSYACRDVTENLIKDYPAPVSGLFNIGLLHTALTGRPGHASYAPCSPADLAAKGYDYWALGHVHQFEHVSPSPPVVFSGCLQGRHAREPGPKGCVRVDVDEHGQALVGQVILDALRWCLVEVDAAGAGSLNDLDAAVAVALQDALPPLEGRLAAVRLRVRGRCPVHAQIARSPEKAVARLRMSATDYSRHRVWIEKVILDTKPELDVEELSRGDTPQAGLVRTLESLVENPEAFSGMGLDLRDLQAKIAPYGMNLPNFDDPDTRTELIREARDLLISMLSVDPHVSTGRNHAY